MTGFLSAVAIKLKEQASLRRSLPFGSRFLAVAP
jgi:hypothetical protein